MPHYTTDVTNPNSNCYCLNRDKSKLKLKDTVCGVNVLTNFTYLGLGSLAIICIFLIISYLSVFN